MYSKKVIKQYTSDHSSWLYVKEFLFVFGGTGILIQGYHLSHMSSPFCSGYFEDGVSDVSYLID
jgi:hypothetical protein